VARHTFVHHPVTGNGIAGHDNHDRLSGVDYTRLGRAVSRICVAATPLSGRGMKNYEPVLSFGKEVAERYDDTLRGDEAETVAFLARLARGGPALELAIGTGRIALPLAARGIQVDGIDISPDMVGRLRAKPGGERLAVTIGDFADVPVAGTYTLIYVVFNTLFNLLTQDDQVRCFANVAAHLGDDGVFVVETLVPTFLMRLRDDQYVDAERIELDEVWLDVGRHDPVAQRLEESHVVLSREGVRVCPIVQRYAWPSELDLMARLAGLRLHARWGGWEGEPFTATSRRHVSVYGW
jgi:SAM-dependent methyltransferase